LRSGAAGSVNLPKEEAHATYHGPGCPPPRRQRPLSRVWEALPDPHRQKALRALGRLLVVNLTPAPPAKEVGYESR
jgi:hypothetical protein